jgi:ribosomal protein L27
VEADGTVGMGRDHTIYALATGSVQFRWDNIKKRQFVSVLPAVPAEFAQSSSGAA